MKLRTLAAALLIATGVGSAQAEIGPAEKPDLKLGFIKLTDMAPLAVAWEQGFFLDEGLFVELIAQANIITAFSMDLNGNGITVSNDVWNQMKPHIPSNADGKPVHPIGAEALKPVIESYRDKGERFRMGMVFPVSTHNYYATYPYPSDAIWYLSQMRRWGQIPEPRSDDWYMETAARVYRADIYKEAAKSLIEDGTLSAEDFPDMDAENFVRPHQGELIDGVAFTPREPNAYIDSFDIGLKGSETP